jgi:hypothetical protein
MYDKFPKAAAQRAHQPDANKYELRHLEVMAHFGIPQTPCKP